MRRGFLGSSTKEPADSRMIHKSTRVVDTLQAAIVGAEKQASIDTNTLASIPTTPLASTNTKPLASIPTTPFVSIDTNPSASTDATHRKAEKVEVLILNFDENGMLRDEEGRLRNSAGQLINAQGAVISNVIDVAEINNVVLSREWYDGVAHDPFQGHPDEDPIDHLECLEEEVSEFEQDKVYANLILCKIFPYSIFGNAFSWFNQLQPGSLKSWEDIKRAFLHEFLDDAKAAREKEINDKWDEIYETSGLFVTREIPRHLKEYVVAVAAKLQGFEQSSAEETVISDPTTTSIDTNISTSIDPKTSESIDTRTTASIDTHHGSEPKDIEQLEDLNSRRKVSMEVEERFDDMDQDLEKKLDDDQHTSRRDLKTSPKASIDLHPPDCIDRQAPVSVARHPPGSIDRHLPLDEPGYMTEPRPVEERMHKSEASDLDIHGHQRPSICTEEADGFHKRVKMTHDPVKFVVPCAVFEIEFPIPPDKASIDTNQLPSIDTPRGSEQNEFEVCRNLFDGGTRSDKSGGNSRKERNWKKRKRFRFDPKLSLIPHFSDGVRKYRVRSRCFSQPYAKLRALFIAEMIDKGDESLEASKS